MRGWVPAAVVWSLASGAPAASEPSEDSVPVAVCTAADRPSLGLVLSGGGARGGAHIGVLQGLEELRVPIDCIAGTSVGAAVGGFYASGLSVDGIKSAVHGIDWSAAFANSTARRYRSFRRKQDDFLSFVDVGAGLRAGRLELPAGLIQGQVVDSIISRTIVETYPERDFDRLPIPFRAVATDMATGAAVVLESGDLALALRASMSLPAVFAPVDIDGLMLVDGGLAMNLPIEVAQSMGADVVIAVDVTSALLARDAMRSVIDVTGQLTTLITQPSIEEQKKLLDTNDILLSPLFDERATFASFAAFEQTIDDGYRAVMRERERIEPLGLDSERYAAHLAAREQRQRASRPTVTFVRLDNRSTIADSVIDARIGEIPLHAPLDRAAVEAAVGRVYGLELFQNVRYALVADDTGAAGVEIRVDERAWGPAYFQIGMHYASSSIADTSFDFTASYLRTGLNALGGEWRAMLGIGDEPKAVADFYQPFGPRASFFVESQVAVRSTMFNVFSADTVAASFDVRETVLEAAAGRVFGSAAEIRSGLRTVEGGYRARIGDPALIPNRSFGREEAFVRLQADTLDSVAFPRAGFAATLEWRESRARGTANEQRFDQISLHAQAARTWRRHTILAALRYDTTRGGEAPLHSRFRIGGLRDLAGLARNELSAQNAARIGISYRRQLGASSRFPTFAGVTFERGNAWEDRRAIGFDDSIGAASLWAGIATPIGPVYVGVGRTNDGRSAAYLSLGGAF